MKFLLALPEILKALSSIVSFIKDAKDKVERRGRAEKLKAVVDEAIKSGNTSDVEKLINK